MKQTFWAIILVVVVQNCGSNPSSDLPRYSPAMGSEREIAYTDKADAFWVTRTGGYHNSPWHGLHAARRQYLEDLYVSANGALLPREAAVVTVDPYQLTRDYPELGIQETWTLLDSSRTLIVQLSADDATHWTVQPAILGGSTPGDFELVYGEQNLAVGIKSLAGMESAYSHLNIWFSLPMTWSESSATDLNTYSSYLTQRAAHDASHSLTIAVTIGATVNDVLGSLMGLESALSQRQSRLATRLAKTEFHSNREDLNQAIPWANASLDALIMDQQGVGIFAGLPWFSDYWGRDIFISFTGAALVSGEFDVAKQILLSFADLQNVDPTDKNYGRVPNRARPDEVIYNTTDGTPWFIRSVWDYYRYTGDEAFLQQLWPAIQHATSGALKNWVDEETGLLVHDDADTWMDAKTQEGAWSPRGDRAIEIQFIWRDQLEITRRLAAKYGDETLQEACANTLDQMVRGFGLFRSTETGHLVDHLNADGSQDVQIRPNVFLVPPLFQETCDWVTFKTLAPELVTKNGVLSLSQTDENFHPYHHLKGRYVQDAAYHNGIIWTWNSAATLSQAVRFHQDHYVSAIFDDLTHHLNDRGAVGTIAELTDAWPRDGELQLSGTFSQAWSLAEYLRVLYQDILGVQPDLTQSLVNFAPRLLPDLHELEFTTTIGADQWSVEYVEKDDSFDISLARKLTDPMHLSFSLVHRASKYQFDAQWETENLHLRFEKNMGQWTVPASIADYQISSSAIDVPIDSLPFLEVDVDLPVPALQGPPYRSLTKAEVIRNDTGVRTIIEARDPAGDDTGDTRQYTYPQNPQFAAGVADIRNFLLHESAGGYIFEFSFADLVDPGWHPEFGYQLSYCALGISYDAAKGTNHLGRNAKATFQDCFKAEAIIYISSGLIMTDAENRPIAEYLPSEESGAIGDALTDRVRFTLPRELFSDDLKDAEFQIAVGCQDDHGGSVIGDFREVEPLAAEWVGGGAGPNSSNIYDWLIPGKTHE
ncbi:MAG: hypothetical protein K9M85_05265 [Candidatus Marinimicrobia bacterium]|nr:hypothetical protein [Candidatus Neomarinimicrobiota bacterium]